MCHCRSTDVLWVRRGQYAVAPPRWLTPRQGRPGTPDVWMPSTRARASMRLYYLLRRYAVPLTPRWWQWLVPCDDGSSTPFPPVCNCSAYSFMLTHFSAFNAIPNSLDKPSLLPV
ncbi:hypothetical protein TRVL_00630 [Trypanosoma vivax]|nr:hypothetical protein TRVL_00630 [Trypanosoma vivax]